MRIDHHGWRRMDLFWMTRLMRRRVHRWSNVSVILTGHRIDFYESSNSFGSERDNKWCRVPYFTESSGYSPSTSGGKICLSLAENDEAKRNIMKGQLDSLRLVQSLHDYLSGNTRKHRTDDKERKLSNVNSPRSFKFRRRIYMDPEMEMAARTRHIKEKMNLSNSELEESTATPLLCRSHIDHQRMQYNTPSSNFDDPCLRAMQALKDNRRTSKTSKYDHIDAVTLKTCINMKLRRLSRPDPKFARKISTILESSKYHSQDLSLHHRFSSKMVCQKAHITEPTDDVDQISSEQDYMHVVPEIVVDTPELLSPRSSEEACHHSPVSVLKSSSNAEMVSDSDHFKHVGAEIQDLRMQLQLLETEFPEGLMAFSNNEDNQEEIWALTCNMKHEASEIKELTKKELVRDWRGLDFGEEIHAIGTELESLLIDELIEDFIYT